MSVLVDGGYPFCLSACCPRSSAVVGCPEACPCPALLLSREFGLMLGCSCCFPCRLFLCEGRDGVLSCLTIVSDRPNWGTGTHLARLSIQGHHARAGREGRRVCGWWWWMQRRARRDTRTRRRTVHADSLWSSSRSACRLSAHAPTRLQRTIPNNATIQTAGGHNATLAESQDQRYTGAMHCASVPTTAVYLLQSRNWASAWNCQSVGTHATT